jgi:flavin-dependent dehydrogenase
MKPKIAIVGAGPAGSSLAIRLAVDGFKVTLIEREKFPRHKLCGEFISPECLAHFRELGVLDAMLSAGGDHITETRFYAASGRNVVVPSAWFGGGGFALSLSRAEMDHQLMKRAREVGVEVLEETSATGLLREGGVVRGITARVKDGKTIEIPAGLVIDATGRAGILSKFLGKKSVSKNRSKFIGFKAHLRNIQMKPGRCEIYFFRGGYGGLSFVEKGDANFCFLINTEAARELNGKTNRIIEEIVFQNARARKTLENAEPVHDWLAVSVEGFGEKELNPAGNLFTVGDAAAFIDPFTGSGMLMAMESAGILAKCIGRDHSSPDALTRTYTSLYKQYFARRLRVCSLLRKAAFLPNLAGGVISALSLSAKAREFLTRSTRARVTG